MAAATMQLAAVLRARDEMSPALQKVADAGRAIGPAVGGALREAASAADRAEGSLSRTAAVMQRVSSAGDRLRAAADVAQISQTAVMATGAMQRLGEATLREAIAGEKLNGVLSTVGFKDFDGIGKYAEDLRKQFAGIDDLSMMEAAYSIKSAVASMSDEQVTMAAGTSAVLAKVTRGTAQGVSSLLAVTHGVFKSTEMAALSDAEAFERSGATVLATVQNFRTTAPQLEAGVKSVGAAAANAGMSMAQQYAILGMLGTTMDGATSGTALRAFVGKLGEADKAFKELASTGKNPIRVRLTNDEGKLRDMADIMADLRKRYGPTLSAREKAELAKVLGNEEAVKLVDALWAKGADEIRKNTAMLTEAGSAGRDGMDKVAKDMDKADGSAGWQIVVQRIEDAAGKIGTLLLPALTEVGGKVASIVESIVSFAEESPAAAEAMAYGGVAAVGAAGLATTAVAGGMAVQGARALFGRRQSAGAQAAPGGSVMAGAERAAGAMPVIVTNWPSGAALPAAAQHGRDASPAAQQAANSNNQARAAGPRRNFGGAGRFLAAGATVMAVGGMANAAAAAPAEGAVDAVTPMIDEAGSLLLSVATAARGLAGKIARPVAAVVSAVDAVDAAARGDTEGATVAAGAGVGGVTGAVVGGIIGSVVPVVGTAVGAAVGGYLGSMAGETAGRLVAATEAAQNVVAVVGDFANRAKAEVASVAEAATTKVSGALGSAWDWVSSPFSSKPTPPAPPQPTPASRGSATTVSMPVNVTIHAAYGQEAEALSRKLMAEVEDAMRRIYGDRTQSDDAALYDR